ncbi:hypothetical protein [Flammeovirga sp. OC4]|uniref:hypothetical protein n=1 Tax=Flammeovirga sp. OC4 TaxID=1382345 RepID=UPI0012E095FE|nr:hypothetical protein [Flammeovirga sp. OC4]
MKTLLISTLLTALSITSVFACHGHYYKCHGTEEAFYNDVDRNCGGGGSWEVTWLDC